jgi:hypothetical protein
MDSITAGRGCVADKRSGVRRIARSLQIEASNVLRQRQRFIDAIYAILARDDHGFFFPFVKRLAVDFVNRSFCDLHAARLFGHEKINVIDCAVGSFHIDTGKIIAAAETGKPIVMDPNQIEREIFAPIVDMKLIVLGFLAFVVDVFLNPARNIRRAHLLRLGGALRRCRCVRWKTVLQR